MHIEVVTLVALVVPVVGAIVWLVRLEGRIDVGVSRHDDIVGRLERIEAKLDRSNGIHHP